MYSHHVWNVLIWRSLASHDQSIKTILNADNVYRTLKRTTFYKSMLPRYNIEATTQNCCFLQKFAQFYCLYWSWSMFFLSMKLSEWLMCFDSLVVEIHALFKFRSNKVTKFRYDKHGTKIEKFQIKNMKSKIS